MPRGVVWVLFPWSFRLEQRHRLLHPRGTAQMGPSLNPPYFLWFPRSANFPLDGRLRFDGFCCNDTWA